jgi:hypothetical protein
VSGFRGGVGNDYANRVFYYAELPIAHLLTVAGEGRGTLRHDHRDVP